MIVARHMGHTSKRATHVVQILCPHGRNEQWRRVSKQIAHSLSLAVSSVSVVVDSEADTDAVAGVALSDDGALGVVHSMADGTVSPIARSSEYGASLSSDVDIVYIGVIEYWLVERSTTLYIVCDESSSPSSLTTVIAFRRRSVSHRAAAAVALCRSSSDTQRGRCTPHRRRRRRRNGARR